MTDGTDAYIKTLQDELARREKDNKALQSELHGDAKGKTGADVIKATLLPEVPKYISNIDALAHASESDSVRLAANKLLIEWAVTEKLVTGGDGVDNDLKKLLAQLSKKDKKEGVS